MSDESNKKSISPTKPSTTPDANSTESSESGQLEKPLLLSGGDAVKLAAGRTQIPLLPLLDRETVQALGVLVSNTLVELLDDWDQHKHIIERVSVSALPADIEKLRDFMIDRGAWLMSCVEALDGMFASGMFAELATDKPTDIQQAEAEFALIPKDKIQ